MAQQPSQHIQNSTINVQARPDSRFRTLVIIIVVTIIYIHIELSVSQIYLCFQRAEKYKWTLHWDENWWWIHCLGLYGGETLKTEGVQPTYYSLEGLGLARTKDW